MTSKIANGYAINNNNNNNNTQSSPPTSPKNRQSSRRRLRRRGSFRRRHLLLVVPLLYFSGLISCVRPLFSLLQPPAGAVYRSHDIFQKLWTDIQADNSSSIQVIFLSWFYLLLCLADLKLPLPLKNLRVKFGIRESPSELYFCESKRKKRREKRIVLLLAFYLVREKKNEEKVLVEC